MKRYQLTEYLPETTKPSKVSPDVRQKLEAYTRDKEEHANIAPDIRPHALEKYDINKESSVIRVDETASDDDDEEHKQKHRKKSNDAPLSRKLSKIPVYAQSKARRLLPFLKELNIGGLNMDDLLYDLTTKGKRLKTENREMLESIIRQLTADDRVPKNLFVNKLAAGGIHTSATMSHNREPGHQKRSRERTVSLPSGINFQRKKSWI